MEMASVPIVARVRLPCSRAEPLCWDAYPPEPTPPHPESPTGKERQSLKARDLGPNLRPGLSLSIWETDRKPVLSRLFWGGTCNQKAPGVVGRREPGRLSLQREGVGSAR